MRFVDDAVDQGDHRGGIPACGLGRAVADHHSYHWACALSCGTEFRSGDRVSLK